MQQHKLTTPQQVHTELVTTRLVRVAAVTMEEEVVEEIIMVVITVVITAEEDGVGIVEEEAVVETRAEEEEEAVEAVKEGRWVLSNQGLRYEIVTMTARIR